MKRRSFLRAGAAMLALGVLSGCGYRQDTFRYRLTVEVETPEGVRKGSAVRQVRYTVPPNIPMLGENKPQWSVKGEAVVVDLPEGRTLFALLKGANGSADYAGRETDFLFRELSDRSRNSEIQLWPSPPQTSRPNIGDPLPLLVTFGNVSDPTSVTEVDPNDLAEAFGEGVTLKRITVQGSNDLVTTGIQKRLRWLSEVRGALVRIPVSDYPPRGTPLPLYGQLTKSDFQRRATS